MVFNQNHNASFSLISDLKTVNLLMFFYHCAEILHDLFSKYFIEILKLKLTNVLTVFLMIKCIYISFI